MLRTFRTLMAGLVAAGLLTTGAATATAADTPVTHDPGYLDDNRIKVLVYRHQVKSDRYTQVESTTLNVKDAARYAKQACGIEDRAAYAELKDKAVRTEHYNKINWLACSFPHGKNKNVVYNVVYKDNPQEEQELLRHRR